MEQWERAALLFDAENIESLAKKYETAEIEFHALDRFLDFETYEGLARWVKRPTGAKTLTLRLRCKEVLDTEVSDARATVFFAPNKFKAYPTIEHNGWYVRGYAQEPEVVTVEEVPSNV